MKASKPESAEEGESVLARFCQPPSISLSKRMNSVIVGNERGGSGMSKRASLAMADTGLAKKKRENQMTMLIN